jgi:hypothetical protein
LSRRFRRWAIPSLALCTLLAVVGCPECYPSGASFVRRSASTDSRGYAESNRYFGVKAKKGGSGGAYAYAPFLVRPPYEISVLVGIFDPESLAIGDETRGCLTFQSEDFVTTFYAVCAEYQREPEGMILETGPLTDSEFLAGEQKAEIRAVAEETTLRLYGRAAGAVDWIELGTGFSIAASPGLRIGGSAAYVPPNAEIGFDDLAFSAGEPADATAGEAAAAPLEAAISAALEAIRALDGDTPDFASAEVSLEAAASSLAAAETAATGLATKAGKKAAKKERAIAKKLAKARARVAEQNAAAALKLIYQAPKALIQALDALLGS